MGTEKDKELPPVSVRFRASGNFVIVWFSWPSGNGDELVGELHTNLNKVDPDYSVVYMQSTSTYEIFVPTNGEVVEALRRVRSACTIAAKTLGFEAWVRKNELVNTLNLALANSRRPAE